MSVAFDEIDDSPHFNAGPRGEMGATRKFRIVWSNVEEFLSELLFGGVWGLPAQFPLFPALRVSGVDIVPFIEVPQGGVLTNHQTQNSTHDHALVTVTYGPGENNTTDNGNKELPDGTWAEYSLDIAGEFVEVPGQFLKFQSDDERLPADVHPVVRVPTISHSVRWHRVYAPPWNHIADLTGLVNSAEWKIPATGMLVSAETLLFASASSAKTYDVKNNRDTWSLEYRFAQKCPKHLATTVSARGGINHTTGGSDTVYGWNHVLRKNGTWDIPVSATTGDKMYQAADFAPLFTVEPAFL